MGGNVYEDLNYQPYQPITAYAVMVGKGLTVSLAFLRDR